MPNWARILALGSECTRVGRSTLRCYASRMGQLTARQRAELKLDLAAFSPMLLASALIAPFISWPYWLLSAAGYAWSGVQVWVSVKNNRYTAEERRQHRQGMLILGFAFLVIAFVVVRDWWIRR